MCCFLLFDSICRGFGFVYEFTPPAKIPLSTSFYFADDDLELRGRSTTASQLPASRYEGRCRAETVAVSSNVQGANTGASTFYVVISPPHLLSRAKQQQQRRLKVKSENANDSGQQEGSSLSLKPEVHNNAKEETKPLSRVSSKDDSLDDFTGAGADEVFEEEKEVKAQLDIMNECMSNVNSLRKITDETITIHRHTLENAEKHLAKLGKGISKKDIELAAPYFRLFRVHKMTQREVASLNQDMKTAESLWTMAEDAVSQLKFNLASSPDVYTSSACAEVRDHAVAESARWKSETESLLKKLIEKQDALTALNKQMAAEFEHRKRVVKKTMLFYEYKIEMEARLEELAEEVTRNQSQLASAKARYNQAMQDLEDLSNAIHVKRNSLQPQTSISSQLSEPFVADALSTSLAIVGNNNFSPHDTDVDVGGSVGGSIGGSFSTEGGSSLPVVSLQDQPPRRPPRGIKSMKSMDDGYLSMPVPELTKTIIPEGELTTTLTAEGGDSSSSQSQSQETSTAESTPRLPVRSSSNPLKPVDLVDILSDEEAV